MHVVAFCLLLGFHTFKTRGEEEWHKEINFNYSSEARILATPKLLVSIKKKKSIIPQLFYHLLFSSHGNLPRDWKLDKHQHPKIPLGFLVTQWWRIYLPVQENMSSSLVWEDPTCCGATKPTSCNSWAQVLQLLKSSLAERALQQEKPLQWEARAPQLESSPHSMQLEKSPCSNENPAQPKSIKIN